ncbi:MAG: hypothetical protein ABSA39_20890 [Edaphobacter sp.]
MNRCGKALFLLLILPFAVFAEGQTESHEINSTAVLRPAVDKYEEAKDSKTRFTYLELVHTQNFNEKGKKTVDYTQLFEVTYIADLEYSRLLEVNGKALSGKALEAEQKRYDDAVQERSALDGFARAKIQHHKMLDAGVNFPDLLAGYRSSVVHDAAIDGCDCVVIDSVPTSSAAKKHYRLWIDPNTSEIRRVDFDELADDGDLLSGGSGSKTFQYLDGVPLVVHSHFDGKARLNNETARVVADHTYSRFRKFSVTTTIVPVTPEGKP